MADQDLEAYVDSEENSKIRAEIWGDFVGWDNRRRGENGFLTNQLRKHNCRKILDVALGDGVDTIYLLQQGFDVSSNEVDKYFRQKAIENAKKAGVDISPTDLDWRDITTKYQKDSFDAVICLGNSLTCLFGRERQLKVLKEFYSLIKPGSILIIDERNYQKILDNREAVLKGKLHSSGKYLYTGTNKVKANFAEIQDEYIIIEYTHQKNGKKAYYKAYPFPLHELNSLLNESGFSAIEQLSDYKSGYNSDADFYQYVCIK